MRVTCPNCGGDHPRWECKRPASKSTVVGVNPSFPSSVENEAVKISTPNPDIVIPISHKKPGASLSAESAKQKSDTLGKVASRTKSTAARKDVQRHKAQRAQPETGTPDCTELASRPQASVRESAAGNQALPVDTTIPKPKIGRPSTGFDKAAYNRAYMKRRRAKEREAK